MVRRFARGLGVDLSRLQGSGPNGRILQDDVQQFVRESVRADSKSRRPGVAESGVLHAVVDIGELERYCSALVARGLLPGTQMNELPFVLKAVSSLVATHTNLIGTAHADQESDSFIVTRFDAGQAASGRIEGASGKGILELAEALDRLAHPVDKDPGAAPDAGMGFPVVVYGPGLDTAPAAAPVPPAAATLALVRRGTGLADSRDLGAAELSVTLAYDTRVVGAAEAGAFLAALGGRLADIREIQF